jgi:hypothetical protein
MKRDAFAAPGFKFPGNYGNNSLFYAFVSNADGCELLLYF